MARTQYTYLKIIININVIDGKTYVVQFVRMASIP